MEPDKEQSDKGPHCLYAEIELLAAYKSVLCQGRLLHLLDAADDILNMHCLVAGEGLTSSISMKIY